MKKSLIKNNFKSISKTRRRFLSILVMAFLGVGFYAGLVASSPDMLDSLDKYVGKNNMYDIDIISKFHEEHIYQARHWEYMLEKYSKNSLEYRLANRLALICTDQRYGKKEIDFQKNIVEKLLNEQESRNV